MGCGTSGVWRIWDAAVLGVRYLHILHVATLNVAAGSQDLGSGTSQVPGAGCEDEPDARIWDPGGEVSRAYKLQTIYWQLLANDPIVGLHTQLPSKRGIKRERGGCPHLRHRDVLDLPDLGS